MKLLLTLLFIFTLTVANSKNSNKSIESLEFGGCGKWTRLIDKDGKVVGKWRQCKGYSEHIDYR